MKNMFRHYLNPLHLFCRLRQCGFPQPAARSICLVYERVYARVL
ncbi:MAG: hypothetical protein AB7E47_08565 [Desulfovibrionaceae bacterium]